MGLKSHFPSLKNDLQKLKYAYDRGLKYKEDNDIYIINRVKSTAVLVELGFLSNYEDLAFLLSEQGKNECSQAMANAIIKYYNKYYHERKQ